MNFEKIRSLISERFDVDEDKITRETNIVDDLGVDSLDIAELLLTLEDEFNISIPEEDIANLKTVGDLVDFMDNQG